MNLTNVTMIVTTTLTGVIAGLFFAYSCSVNPGLARLDNTAYLQAMQNINRAILNPVFLCCFMGAALLLVVSCWMQFSNPPTIGFWLVMSAAIIYIVGVLGVTMAGNVPLNNSLDAFEIKNATAEKLQQMRDQFELPWGRLHSVRTWASVVSFVLLVIANKKN